MLTRQDSALVKDTQDWLTELHELRDRALSRHDTVQAEELTAEIAELAAYLDTAFETTA